METWIPGTHHTFGLDEYGRARIALPVPHLPKEETEARKGKKDGLSARAMGKE